MMIWLAVVWIVFATIFIALGCFHWKKASKSISYLQVKQLIPEGVEMKIGLGGVDFLEFIDKFNKYIEYYNKTSKNQNKAQAIGYWVAALVAVFSFVLTMVGK